MLNTWWLCVILQYHSISHAFCRHTTNGITFHYLDVWYAVILISHYFSLGIRLLYKLWYCDNDFIKTMWKSVSLLHLPENHWCSKTCRWNRACTLVSSPSLLVAIPSNHPIWRRGLISISVSEVIVPSLIGRGGGGSLYLLGKKPLFEEWLGPNHSAKAY